MQKQPRQPLCPYCHYNLAGSVDAFQPRFARCPECGEGIEPHEYYYPPKPGQWTQMRGLRNVAISLLVRMVLVCAVWVGMIAAMDLALSGILGDSGAYLLRIMFLPLIFCGMIIGWLMLHKLFEHAGAESWLVSWLAIVATWTAMHVAHLATGLLNVNLLTERGWGILAAAGATVWIVYLSFREME